MTGQRRPGYGSPGANYIPAGAPTLSDDPVSSQVFSPERISSQPPRVYWRVASPSCSWVSTSRLASPIGVICQLTTDGSKEILNGKLDYVYQEEVYGRNVFKGYWWSPDSARIAFLRLDERDVPQFTIVDDIPYHLRLNTFHYPKAGDPNPAVRLGVVSITTGALRWIDTSKYTDFLIVNVGWTPDGAIVYQIQDRQQTWLDLNRADPQSGRVQTLLRETSDAWVERWQDASVDPTWLNDGSFLWLSERTGWRHAYSVSADGKDVRPITKGDFDVISVQALDETGGWLYFYASPDNATQRYLYRAKLDGSGSSWPLSPGIAAVGHHNSPARVRPGDPGTKEAECRLKDDDLANLQSRQHDDRVHHVGKDVLEHDAHVGRTGHLRTGDEVQLFDRERLATDLAGVADPQQSRDHSDNREEPRSEHRDGDHHHRHRDRDRTPAGRQHQLARFNHTGGICRFRRRTGGR